MTNAPTPAGMAEAALGRLTALLTATHLTGDAPVPGLGAVSWNDLRILAALAPVAAEGEVEPEAFDRMMAVLENPPLASEELKARLRDARRLIATTPPAAQSEGGAGHE